MIHFPGFDGVGIFTASQFPNLAEVFELWHMTFNTVDWSSFEELTNSMVNFIDDILNNNSSGQQIYKTGGSFGLLLAPSGALCRQLKLDGLIMINPATYENDTSWNSFPLLMSLRHLKQRTKIWKNGIFLWYTLSWMEVLWRLRYPMIRNFKNSQPDTGFTLD